MPIRATDTPSLQFRKQQFEYRGINWADEFQAGAKAFHPTDLTLDGI